MARNTKERILEAALEIFARDGYEATNVKDIADAVGLVKSGVYKHFDSKETLWNEIINMVAVHYGESMAAHRAASGIPKTLEELRQMTMKMVDFTMHDRQVILVRKILTKEQYRDEKMRDLANRYFLYDTEHLFTKVFETMMEWGTIKRDDPELLAFAYTTPISTLIHLCDREPDKEPEVMARLESFVKLFINEFGIKGEEKNEN